MTYTVLGAAGQIGSHMVEALSAGQENVIAIDRAPMSKMRGLGDVLDCAGLTGDFRERPFDLVEAHVNRVARLLSEAEFDSYLYLSSTRVYRRGRSGEERAEICVRPDDPEDIYAISKAMGESVCLRDPRPTVRVVRLSNVYGPSISEGLVASLVVEAIETGRVTLRAPPTSVRDLVHISDVVDLLPRISRGGRQRIYNVASGEATTLGQVATMVAEVLEVPLASNPSEEAFSLPAVSVERIRSEFEVQLRELRCELPPTVQALHGRFERDLEAGLTVAAGVADFKNGHLSAGRHRSERADPAE